MVINPAFALATMTLVLAIYLVISGVFEVMMALQIKPVKGWGWVLLMFGLFARSIVKELA